MPDTLVIDTAQIARWQSQPDFEYSRELADDGMTFSDWLLMKLGRLLDAFFDSSSGSAAVRWTLIFIAVAALVLAVWYLWCYQPWLFHRQETLVQDGDEAVDNIYGVDFDAALAQALAAENYREAIRVVYLQTLKALADARLIDWQPFKTPSQYVHELAPARPSSAPSASGPLCSGGAAAPAFRSLTAHFLRVRYGNFPATRALYDDVQALRKEVCP